MNVHQAIMYALAASPSGDPDDIDLRLAAYLAAAHQHGLAHGAVGWDVWWAARCQLGLLVGTHLPQAAFGVALPCGKANKTKQPGANAFCDPAHLPTREAFNAALRRLALMRHGAGLKPWCSEAGLDKWPWPEVDLPFCKAAEEK